ncbi:MerR family transcriptional regulator [Caulobacter soli]|uniref:MerR family transcriptional regulator n=1 Tax=Caulobacter soli TaxID=2708539 RepID=UPI0013EBAD97|nr:MerR family transcriptional regulator [Caulobacter soli]
MKIQEAADHLGVSTRTLRHYEAEGLIAPRRAANGYRTYSPPEIEKAEWVRDFIASGFSTRELRKLLAALEDGSGAPPVDCAILMRRKLEQIDRIMAALGERRDALAGRLERWEQEPSPHAKTPAPDIIDNQRPARFNREDQPHDVRG